MTLSHFKGTRRRETLLHNKEQTVKLFLKAHASDFLGSEPQANRSTTAAFFAFLFSVAVVELKNTTIWRGRFYFPLKLAKSEWMLSTGPLAKQRLGLKPHKKGCDSVLGWCGTNTRLHNSLQSHWLVMFHTFIKQTNNLPVYWSILSDIC